MSATLLKFRDETLADLPDLYAERTRLETELRRTNAAILEAENAHSRALGYCVPLRGQMLLEAMNRNSK